LLQYASVIFAERAGAHECDSNHLGGSRSG
jgi:hypothetical protein